jgi:hypothetical protein
LSDAPGEQEEQHQAGPDEDIDFSRYDVGIHE